MGALRAIFILIGFAVFTVPLMPLQAMFVLFDLRAARTFPHWYHRKVARIFGLSFHQAGAIEHDRPVLLVANHVSWLDIIVLSAVTPVSFVAKMEISRWPFISWLAKLQRTIFIDRKRRRSAAEVAQTIGERLQDGDAVLFFPEGKAGDGNAVLPFNSSLFAAVFPPKRGGDGEDAMRAAAMLSDVQVQTVTIAYTHVSGLPLGRSGRPLVAWYGHGDLVTHAWRLLTTGPIDVTVSVGAPVPLEGFSNRKALADATRSAISAQLADILRFGGPDGPPARETIRPASDARDDDTRDAALGAGGHGMHLASNA